MDITYLGAGSVKLTGKMMTVVCDPYDGSAGLGKLNVKADVVTVSAMEGSGADRFGQVAGAMALDGPGEYEVKGAMITGVPARLYTDAESEGKRGTVFGVLIDGVNVVVTGNVAGKLDESEVEQLGKVDVLVTPVGGGGLTLDAVGAAALVTQLEPGYVVPVHYDDGVTKYPAPQDGVGGFLKEMGGGEGEAQSKLRVSAKEVPAETQAVVLKRG